MTHCFAAVLTIGLLAAGQVPSSGKPPTDDDSPSADDRPAADDRQAAQEQAEKREFQVLAKELALEYDIRPVADSKTDADSATAGSETRADSTTTFELREEPILRWSNPVVGRIYGAVYIWTDHGRPAAVASLYKWYHPHHHTSHEFQSLSPNKLVAKRNEAEVWTPVEGGVEFKGILGAPPPAKTPAARLRQMRSLVGEFRADETDRGNVQSNLRLLPQPVYRYPEMDGKVLDGALFAFVQSTDPELWLLVEARPRDSVLEWHYALARMNSIRFRVFHRDQQVAELPTLPWADVRDPSKPYTVFQFN